MTALPASNVLNPEVSSFVPEVNTQMDEYDHEAIVENMVRFQVEYHFSDTNLAMDNYLVSRMHEDKEYWVPVKIVCNLTKIRALTDKEDVVLNAIRKSDIVILNSDQTKVKRPNYIPPKPKLHKDLRRTAFLYGLSKDVTKEQIIALCSEYGTIKDIVFDENSIHDRTDPHHDQPQTSLSQLQSVPDPQCQEQQPQNASMDEDESITHGPDREVAVIIMTKKFGTKIVRNSTSSNHGENIDSIPSSLSVPHPSRLSGFHPIPNPNGNPLDFSHLRSCFITFESQSQSNKLVKARSRYSEDGILAMHQYDYNKATKKILAAKACGISPLFSPSSIALTLNSPSFSSPLSLSSVRSSSIFGNNNDDAKLQLPQSMTTRATESQISRFPKPIHPKTTTSHHHGYHKNNNNHPQQLRHSYHSPYDFAHNRHKNGEQELANHRFRRSDDVTPTQRLNSNHNNRPHHSIRPNSAVGVASNSGALQPLHDDNDHFFDFSVNASDHTQPPPTIFVQKHEHDQHNDDNSVNHGKYLVGRFRSPVLSGRNLQNSHQQTIARGPQELDEHRLRLSSQEEKSIKAEIDIREGTEVAFGAAKTVPNREMHERQSHGKNGFSWRRNPHYQGRIPPYPSPNNLNANNYHAHQHIHDEHSERNPSLQSNSGELDAPVESLSSLSHRHQYQYSHGLVQPQQPPPLHYEHMNPDEITMDQSLHFSPSLTPTMTTINVPPGFHQPLRYTQLS
jgi:hypothetical protein